MSVYDFLDTWIREKVSQPSPETANIPACPYALKAWVEEKVKIVEVANLWEEVAEQIKVYRRLSGGDLFSNTAVNIRRARRLLYGFERLSSIERKDIWLLSFQDTYDMILIQRLSHLDEASFWSV